MGKSPEGNACAHRPFFAGDQIYDDGAVGLIERPVGYFNSKQDGWIGDETAGAIS